MMNKKEFERICRKYKFTSSYSGVNKRFYVNMFCDVDVEKTAQFKDEVKDCSIPFEFVKE